MSPFTMTATLRTPTAPEPILVDTSAWYALVDRADANHRRAVSTLAQLAQEGALLLTHNYVVVETVALLPRRQVLPGSARRSLLRAPSEAAGGAGGYITPCHEGPA